MNVLQYCKGDLSLISSLLHPASIFSALPSLSAFLLSHHKNTISFFPPCQNQTLPLFPHPLSLCLHPFLLLPGHSSDRHCRAVALLCLSAGESGPAFTLSSIAAWVSSKAAIQPAQSLPTGNRPTKEKGGCSPSLLCSVWSGLPPPPPINNTTLPQQKEIQPCSRKPLLPSSLYSLDRAALPLSPFSSPLLPLILAEKLQEQVCTYSCAYYIQEFTLILWVHLSMLSVV